jgi:uncharacterized delta-60 repeat protein
MNRKRIRATRLSVEPLEDRYLLSAGFLDPTFAGDGMVTTNVGLAEWGEQAWDVAVYPGATPGADGKILAVGNSATRTRGGLPDQDFALVRYNPDGSLDAGFGKGGKVTTSLSSGNDFAMSVELVGAKILAAGFAAGGGVGNGGGGFALARYNDNGSLDITFGSKGKVVTKINNGGFGMAMKVDASGRIVMTGLDGNGALAVVRYTSNGALDKTFGQNGIVITSFPHALDGNLAEIDLAITPASAGAAHAGKIVVVGRTSDRVGPSTTFVARYTPAGILDMTFDADGLVNLPTSGLRQSVAVQDDGRILVVHNQELYRLNTDGTFDTSFDGDGRVTSTRRAVSTAVTQQPDGKILVAGTEVIDASASPWQRGFFVARYTSSGALDPTYGTGGVGLTTEGNVDAIRVAMALQANSKVVVAAKIDIPWPTGGTVSDFAVARFEGDAALHAAAVAPNRTFQTLNPADLQPLVNEALARWHAVGMDTRSLDGTDIRIADLGGTTLGLASGHTIWLDDNAAGWGWFVDPTPRDDAEFTTPGNQGEQGRMDLLTTLAHEIGHLLGHEHEEDGVMIDTLATGIRCLPGSTEVNDRSAIIDVLVSEPLSKRRR